MAQIDCSLIENNHKPAINTQLLESFYLFLQNIFISTEFLRLVNWKMNLELIQFVIKFIKFWTIFFSGDHSFQQITNLL